jgi:hypothetical protein
MNAISGFELFSYLLIAGVIAVTSEFYVSRPHSYRFFILCLGLLMINERVRTVLETVNELCK